MDKLVLERILRDQKAEFLHLLSEDWCHRSEEKLIDLNSRLAQVVIGVRRSGKSTLCINVIKDSGLEFAYVNFEDENLAGISSDNLNDILEMLYRIYGDFRYMFLDEIQNVTGWQYFVNRLLRGGMHILMTGSNAKLLSSELSTHMTGRYMQTELFPFSFREYCMAADVPMAHGTTREKGLLSRVFDRYLREGGFPELINESRKQQYIDSLVRGIIQNDIEKRFRISYTESFERMAAHILNIVPFRMNFTDLARLFGFSSSHTAENYAGYLEKAYLIICIPKFSFKSSMRVCNTKAYPVDVALMDKRKDAFAPANLDWRLESIVLLELLRRYRPLGYDIAYFDEKAGECDFLVCQGRNAVSAVQVCYDISDERTRRREIKGLILAAQKTGCSNLVLITDSEEGEIIVDGRCIRIVPAYEWIIDPGT